MGNNVSKASHGKTGAELISEAFGKSQNDSEALGKTGAELISEAFGMSQNDSEALLAQASEVQTTDIPLGKEDVYARDSTTTTLNNLHEDNTSAILDRNGPR
ncbi:cAMP-binding protein [Solibacillus sp. NPDC093137]|uniref:cAMP-binding protein n=1 Tax=Solibacillus sp. NPDC093137 TaxID=3390678 RepID=UPI003D0239D0